MQIKQFITYLLTTTAAAAAATTTTTIFIINERNITKLTNATYPEYHARSCGQRFLN